MECELRGTQVHKERRLEDTSKDLQAMGTRAAANSAVTPGHVARAAANSAVTPGHVAP